MKPRGLSILTTAVCFATIITAEMSTSQAKKNFASLLKPKAPDEAAAVEVKEEPETKFLAKLHSKKSSMIEIEDWSQYKLFLNKTAAIGNVLFFTAPNCARCKTVETLLTKSIKMLKKDKETKGKFKYAKIDGTVLRNTSSGELVAKELGLDGAPTMQFFKVNLLHMMEQIKLRSFGTGMENANNMFDYMKEQITGRDKLGRVKMGKYYFDQKAFQKKLDGLGFGDVSLGTDEEGKNFIDTSKMTRKEPKVEETDDDHEDL